MSQKWRKYPPEFRREALMRMKDCSSVAGLARELGIRRKLLYIWKDAAAKAQAEPPKEAPGSDEQVPERMASAKAQEKIKQLEALLARQSLELDFFKGALQRVEERRRKREAISGPPSTSKSGK